jgi:hypothetical protein
MNHRKVSDPLNSWLVIAALLVVLFSSMVEPYVAFMLSIGVALMFATIRIIQSRRHFEKRGEKL